AQPPSSRPRPQQAQAQKDKAFPICAVQISHFPARKAASQPITPRPGVLRTPGGAQGGLRLRELCLGALRRGKLHLGKLSARSSWALLTVPCVGLRWV